jgi:hypothetical protein
MNTLLKRIGVTTLLAAVALGFTTVADAAEKKIAYSKTARQTVMEARMPAGGIPERELVQSVYIDTCKSADRDFDGMEERVYGQDENSAGGNGSHRGYAVDQLKSGDQLFQRYEGRHRFVAKDAGAWEVTYEGKAEIIGGTGKYKNARGWLNYKGRITPESFSEEDVGEIAY